MVVLSTSFVFGAIGLALLFYPCVCSSTIVAFHCLFLPETGCLLAVFAFAITVLRPLFTSLSSHHVYTSAEFFASLVVMPLSCVVAFSADLHMSMQLGRLRSRSCSRVFLISSCWMLHTSLAFSRFSVIAP